MHKYNFIAYACGRSVHNMWYDIRTNYRSVHSRLSPRLLQVGKSLGYTTRNPQPTRALGLSYQQYYTTSAPVMNNLIPTIHTPYINQSKLKKGILL